MIDVTDRQAPPFMPKSRRVASLMTIGALAVGLLVRLSVVVWADPWSPHQPDEHILPLEAIALWEGITPREVGWPGSTTRLVLSASEAVQWMSEEGSAAWQLRKEPGRVLDNLGLWIARRYVDPTPLYKLGRATSIVIGVLQLIALVWALRQWAGPWAAAAGTLAVAIGPLPVAYSQYVLADTTGVLFATILVGLAAHPTPQRLLAMGALGALAMTSKFHFGLWLLTPLLWIWSSPGERTVRRVMLTASVAGIATWVLVSLVPWFWTNPLLALKEFSGVVLVKIGSGAPIRLIPSNLTTVFHSMGVLTWLGAVLFLLSIRPREVRRLLPLLVPVLIGTLVLAISAIVFDRYGLVLLPGVAVFAGVGWERWLLQRYRPVAVATAVACGACSLLTVVALVYAERRVGEADVDVLAKGWILGHVPRGSRVAVQDEDNAFLPRTEAQLRTCAGYVQTPEAYVEKWQIEGIGPPARHGQPIRSMLLTDEQFAAYWCERELEAQQDPGFYVLTYHDAPRFRSLREDDTVSEFRSGTRALTGGVDVLVMNRLIDVGVPPAQVFRTERGVRAIYVARRTP